MKLRTRRRTTERTDRRTQSLNQLHTIFYDLCKDDWLKVIFTQLPFTKSAIDANPPIAGMSGQPLGRLNGIMCR
ncbi:hypothetical protein TNCV_1877971 [Trichonephila clavipes]|nr:hypothetical protein TNCV_1877971 [Trichonephila clavipes]